MGQMKEFKYLVFRGKNNNNKISGYYKNSNSLFSCF